jgi:hypothetical protein
MPYFGRGTFLVVGQDFDKDGNTTRSVTFIDILFIRHRVAERPGPFLYGPFDVVFRHVLRFSTVNGDAQPRVGLGIAPTYSGGRRYLPDQFREDLSALCIGRAFFMLNGTPFAMS